MHSAYKSQMPKEHRSFFRDERVSEAEFNCAVEKEDMEMAQCPYWETDRSSSSSAFNYFPTASNSRVRRITFADDSDRKEEAKLRRNRVTSVDPAINHLLLETSAGSEAIHPFRKIIKVL
jgi:hypothetical protein